MPMDERPRVFAGGRGCRPAKVANNGRPKILPEGEPRLVFDHNYVKSIAWIERAALHASLCARCRSGAC